MNLNTRYGNWIEITKLHEFAQAAFNGYKSLNLIQIHIFHTAYYTNENILVCAPTGAGKTNIAVISILHEYGSISSILRFRWYEALVARTLRQGYCDIGMFIFKNVYQMSVTTYMLLLQFMVESTQTMIRIVGLSATLLNYLEFAQFLRVNPEAGLFFFDSSYRPVPLA
ncbi:unnamed protein product [Prunus armeniaca]